MWKWTIKIFYWIIWNCRILVGCSLSLTSFHSHMESRNVNFSSLEKRKCECPIRYFESWKFNFRFGFSNPKNIHSGNITFRVILEFYLLKTFLVRYVLFRSTVKGSTFQILIPRFFPFCLVYVIEFSLLIIWYHIIISTQLSRHCYCQQLHFSNVPIIGSCWSYYRRDFISMKIKLLSAMDWIITVK